MAIGVPTFASETLSRLHDLDAHGTMSNTSAQSRSCCDLCFYNISAAAHVDGWWFVLRHQRSAWPSLQRHLSCPRKWTLFESNAKALIIQISFDISVMLPGHIRKSSDPALSFTTFKFDLVVYSLAAASNRRGQVRLDESHHPRPTWTDLLDHASVQYFSAQTPRSLRFYSISPAAHRDGSVLDHHPRHQ